MISAPACTSSCISGTIIPGSGSPAVIKGMSAFLRFWRSLPNSVEIRDMNGLCRLEGDMRSARNGGYILVATPRQVHQQQLIGSERRCEPSCVSQGMAGFERGNDPFVMAQCMECFQSLLIGYSEIFGTSAVLEPGMLRTYARVIQACRNGMCFDDLPILILDEVSAIAVQHARSSLRQGGGMLIRLHPVSGCFHSDHPDAAIEVG